jgi:hypothetical protein
MLFSSARRILEDVLVLTGRHRSEALPGLALDRVDSWTAVDACSPR